MEKRIYSVIADGWYNYRKRTRICTSSDTKTIDIDKIIDSIRMDIPEFFYVCYKKN